jgi:radical SAM superfamily enzyme YgiQ (UPF0313 family)
MARIALVKLFTGLNLGVSQLSGELQRAGHESRVIYLKDYKLVPQEEAHRYQTHEMADSGVFISARAKKMNINVFTPFSDREYDLLLDTLREFNPDLIGFSLWSLPLREVGQVTMRIKQHLQAPIIWGGVGPTVEPDRCLQFADMVCVGEGEELIVALADALDAGRDYSKLPNLVIKKEGEIVRNPSAPLVDIEKIAIPDFDKSRIVYINDGKRRRNIYPPNLGNQYAIMTQRGCPYSCSFCIESYYQDKFGKKDSVRRRSVDVVIKELVEAKQKFGIRAVMFYDDVFTIHPKWLREFAPRYKAEVGLPFWAYTYPRTTRREEIMLLRDAGLSSMTIGIQSGAAKVLATYNRPVAPDLTIKAGQILVDCGVRPLFDLITQSDVETEETCRETFDFLLKLPREMKTTALFPMTKFPEYGYTRTVERQHKKSPLSEQDYEYYHRLYLLTRSEWPRGMVRALGKLNLLRRFPRLLDPLLPKQLPFFWLEDHAIPEPLTDSDGDDDAMPPTLQVSPPLLTQ